MCGIAGILNLRDAPPVEARELPPMVAQLAPRGPDGRGYYCDGRVGLGHARLSIIDLEGGAQPIANEDGSVWVVFNGEIFNYVELRSDLLARGHRFATRTDTEVLVHLYEEYGDAFVHHLNGQFAFALWDAPRSRLLLVRDRPGILPLFFTVDGDRLLFGSEVKSILPALRRAPRLDAAALDELMTFWAPTAPRTLFEGVEQVAPGEMLVVEDGRLSRQVYWDWSFPEDDAYLPGSADLLAEELRELLIDATRIRLRADVPVGAYLSGGLDSSALVSIIHRHGDAALRTFSIGFEEEDLDESSFQQQMISHVGADHSRILCSNAAIGQDFPAAIFRTETPILRTAPVPMAMLSGLVREQGYKVVLTGEGADEVLGGYDLFKEGKIRRFWAQNADSRWRPLLLQRLYPYLDFTRAQGLPYLKNFFGVGLAQPESPFFSHLTRWQTTAQCKLFFSPELQARLREDAVERLAAGLPAGIGRWHGFNRAQYVEARTLMASYLLCSQGDRMLMANSVEGRFPFLDHRVIEFANQIHPRLKMRVLNEKYLLKQAMRGYLPEAIRARYKQPYRAPGRPAFFGPDEPAYVREMLSPEAIGSYGYFDAARVERLHRKVERGRAIGQKDTMALVGILSTQLWHHHFVERFRQNFPGDVAASPPDHLTAPG